MDSIIAQYDPVYLHLLIDYNRILVQRNALLRNFADSQSRSAGMIRCNGLRRSDSESRSCQRYHGPACGSASSQPCR